jgi:hypothetical protein
MEEKRPYALTGIQTRFLYPFLFDPGTTTEAAEKLQTVDWNKPGDQTQSAQVWECTTPADFYRDEVLNHVWQFLFAENGSACGYAKVRAPSLVMIFRHPTRLVLENPVTLAPINKIGIELFVTSHGLGVLSIALRPDVEQLGLNEAIDFNYHLARYGPMPAVRLRVSHPSDDATHWARIPEKEQARIPKTPAPDAEFLDRIGSAGGSFQLPELIDHLLAPLRELNLRPTQQGLAVYTVARFGSEVDFQDAQVRSDLGPFLAALAQVEESGHAGAVANEIGVSNVLLNRRHWAGVGLLGAVHLVADQGGDDEEHPFNEQRVPRVRDKYFIPYLMALFQRLFLNQTISEASEIARSRELDAADRLANLREATLRFAVEGHFVQVSSREVLHRFYRAAQEGMDIPQAWQEVNYAIDNLDRRFSTERELALHQVTANAILAINRIQTVLAENVEASTQTTTMIGRVQTNLAHNVDSIKKVQHIVHIIEYFLVGVYTAHLFHMAFAESHVKEAFGEYHEWFLPVGVILAFLVGFIAGVPLVHAIHKGIMWLKHSFLGGKYEE